MRYFTFHIGSTRETRGLNLFERLTPTRRSMTQLIFSLPARGVAYCCYRAVFMSTYLVLRCRTIDRLTLRERRWNARGI